VDGSYAWTPAQNTEPKPLMFYWIACADGGSDDVGVPAGGTAPEAGPYNWKVLDILINGGTTLEASVQPSARWQLISIPITVSGDASAVLNDSMWGDGGTDWDYLLWYDPSDAADHWKAYNKNWPPQLNDMPDLDNAKGLWIRITRNDGDGALTVGQGLTPKCTEIPLYAGWNLVGYPSLRGDVTVATALWGTGADMVEVFDSSAPYGTRAVGPTYQMKPGEAYWVHAPADAVWIVDW